MDNCFAVQVPSIMNFPNKGMRKPGRKRRRWDDLSGCIVMNNRDKNVGEGGPSSIDIGRENGVPVDGT